MIKPTTIPISEQAIVFDVPFEGLETVYDHNKKIYKCVIPTRLAPDFIKELLKTATEGVVEEIKKVMFIKKPHHGTCCTCQACGYNYDDCMCHSNGEKVAKLLSTLKGNL